MHGRLVKSNVGEPGDQALVDTRRQDLVEWTPEGSVGAQSPFEMANLIRILLRWKLLFLVVVGICVLLAALWAATQTPLYRASATLELNAAPARVVDINKAEERPQPDRDFMMLQIGLIKSRDLAERVARSLGLGRNETFLGYEPKPGASAEAAVGPLMAGFAAKGTASDRVLQISFVHPDPQIAARVTNVYATQAVENVFERATESTSRSRAYLQRRLEATRQELERSERELIAYARNANIVNVVTPEGPTSGDSAGGTLNAANLVALTQQLAHAQNARIETEQRAAQAGASARAASTADPTVQALQERRAELQAEYARKSERFLPEYPEMVSLRSQLATLASQIAQASGRAGSSVTGTLRADVVAARNRERALETQIKRLEQELLNLNDRGVQYTILRRAVDANRSLYNALLSKLGEENTAGTRSSSVAIIDTAEVPGAPFSPNVPRTLVLGLLAGLVLGTGSCIAIDRWRDTIDGPADITALGLPVLGVIPRLAKSEEVDTALWNPRSPIAEAYHSTRASIQFMGREGMPKSILFTSSRASEGKTSSVIATAADFVSVGMRVVVIDADLRQPSLRGRTKDGGLAAILNGTRTAAEETNATETPDLYLIHAGIVPPDPTVLLASKAFSDLLQRLEQQFDVVIIDGPPVLGLADAPLIASLAAATVLVIESGRTRRRVVLTALSRLYDAGAILAGGLLTKVNQEDRGYGYGGYGYGYEYGSSGEPRSRELIGPRAKTEEQV